MSNQESPPVREIVKRLSKKMKCNCGLNNWQPERSTGHSWVCRIHKKAMRVYHQGESEDV